MAVLQSRPKLKTSFKKTRTIAPLYTSGPVAITLDGSKLATCVAEEIILTDITTGIELCRCTSDTQSITSLCITPSSHYLLAFTASLSLRIFDISSLDATKKRIQPIRVISRAHEAPIHVCTADPTSTYLASGSADGVVKVWDIVRGYVTHVFKGHGGVVSALAFNYPQDPTSITQRRAMRLITASVDTRIRIFNLTDGASTSSGGGKPESILEGHVSVPRGLDVSPDGEWLLSGGRDSVVLLWNLHPGPETHSSSQTKPTRNKNHGPVRLVKTFPVLERVEAVGFLKDETSWDGTMSNTIPSQFYTGGEKGIVKIWGVENGKETFSLGDAGHIFDDQEEQRQIVNVLYLPSTQTLTSIHADQNIMLYSLATRSLSKQLIGYNDEIVDATFIRPPQSFQAGSSTANAPYLALATNSSLIRVYSTENMDARLLAGHADIVLALSSGPDGSILASGSKDRCARIWAAGSTNHLSWGFSCIAVCEGHTESVGAVAMSRVKSDSVPNLRFMFTGSQDRTIKMWDLSGIADDAGEPVDSGEVVRCKSLTTHKAHDRDINSLDVSPNDRLLASGSQDRTAKVYAIEYSYSPKSVHGELKLLGTFKGHKRGVWSVRFCQTNRLVATGSGDKSVKLWNLDDFSCLKTFEGHTNSVLRVDFFNAGLQLVTTASDGLVKIWSIQEEECKATLDNHEDKVWALAISADDRTIVSGGADSLVTFWEDNTEEQEAEKEGQRTELVLKDQEFQNFVSIKNYKKAIQLALAMGQPGRLLALFRDIISAKSVDQEAITGLRSLDEVICSLDGSDLAKLLRYVRDWNTSAKTSSVAQTILFAVVKLRSAEDLIQTFKDESSEKHVSEQDLQVVKAVGSGEMALKELVDALIPYSERHLSRLDRLMQESYVVDYILGEMDNGIFEVDDLGDTMTVVA